MAGYRLRIHSLLIATALALAGVRAAAASFPWSSGSSDSFSRLPLRGNGDLVEYVRALVHPSGYAALDPPRELRVQIMFDAIQAGIDAMTGRNTGFQKPGFPDWCAIMSAANDAGYRLGRFYDSTSRRWFIVGNDFKTGQAYFLINPEPRRDLIIEAPHVYASTLKLETGTAAEGALLLRQTLGRALLINGADRCQGPINDCGKGTFSSSQVCTGHSEGEKYRKSDSAHNTENAFYVLHKKFTDVAKSTRFVQLHGNADERLPPGGISVSDGRKWIGSSGLATKFANAIQLSQTVPQCAVNDCTIEDQNLLCANLNVEGRYTNDPKADACGDKALEVGGGRFLHLEQRSGAGTTKSLIDAPQPVIDALNLIFPCPGCSIPAQPFDSDRLIPVPPTCPEAGLLLGFDGSRSARQRGIRPRIARTRG
jgi:hypothetical protein